MVYGTSEMWMVFRVLLKHLKAFSPSSCPANGTWAMWDAQSQLATALQGYVCIVKDMGVPFGPALNLQGLH